MRALSIGPCMEVERTLIHGDRLIVGSNHVFRYHDPAFAAAATAVGRPPPAAADWHLVQEELRRSAVRDVMGSSGPQTRRNAAGDVVDESEEVRAERRRRWRAALSRRILQLLPLVDEANGMCAEMGIKVGGLLRASARSTLNLGELLRNSTRPTLSLLLLFNASV